MTQKAPSRIVLAYDLGGTKVAVGVVNSRGKVLEELRMPVLLEKGPNGVVEQLTELGKELLSRHPGIKQIGIASAGPLDPRTGILLDPTNFSRGGKRWGKVPLAQKLSKKLKRPVTIENDAAAAIMAEAWVGAAKGMNNAMILTLGTGLGTGVIANAQLVRSGRFLHPEGGHMIIRAGDPTAECGCGNLGCAEALLSGNGFARRAAARLQNPGVTGKDVAALARNKYPEAIELFDEYSELMAVAIHNYIRLYAPEVVIFTGSFAATHDLFLSKTRSRLSKMCARMRDGIDMLPRLQISKLNNQAGLIGAGWIALTARERKLS